MAAYHYQQGDRPLDGYTIQYALGRGGFGEVYFAVSDSGREVALKAVQNFEDVELRGIGHCMNLKSPQLVMIFDIRYAEDGTPWVIMEYVAGASLREILDEAPDGLEPEQATYFLQELAKGLSYLHEAGVVHRDLKPHNVFFEDGIVKIGDYSLSKVITASHRSGNTLTVGSVHYMAPEISLGRYDKTVDIYALGVMFYEMLTGNPPYVGESLGEVLMKHLSSDPDVSMLKEPLASVVAKAMHRDPAQRFQTAQEMAEAAIAISSVDPQQATFHAATLSLIGERSRQSVEDGRRIEVPVPDAPSHDFTIPVPDQPTAELNLPPEMQEEPDYTYGKPGPAAEVPILQRRTGILQTLCLHYSPSGLVHAIPDRMGLMARVFLVVLAVFVIAGMGLRLDPFVPWQPHEISGVAVSLAAFFCVQQGVLARLLPMGPGWRASIAARFLWTISFVVGFAFPASKMQHLDYKSYMLMYASVLVSSFLLDWRCLTASDRHPRLSVPGVISVGVIAAAANLLITMQQPQFTNALLAASLTMAAAVSVQLVAPLRRATVNAAGIANSADVAENPQRVGDGLQYDFTALLLELIVGAAIMIAATSHLFGHNHFLSWRSLAAVLGGLLALRVRLIRRESVPVGEYRIVNDEPFQGHRVRNHWKMLSFAVVILSWLFIRFGGMANVVSPILILGGLLLVVALFVFRRRQNTSLGDGIDNGTAPMTQHMRRRSKQQFDTNTVWLEILIGICALTVTTVCMEGTWRLSVVACAAVVVGVVALRFRINRSFEPSQPLQGESVE